MLMLLNVMILNFMVVDFILGQGVYFVGDSGVNILVGMVYVDNLSGLVGNDCFKGFDGNDLFDGGFGFDCVDYVVVLGGIIVNLVGGIVFGVGVGIDMLVGIEGIVGSDYVDMFVVIGFVGDIGIVGINVGFNEFEGCGGDDSIMGVMNSFGVLLMCIFYVSVMGSVIVDFVVYLVIGNVLVGIDMLVGVGFVGVVGFGFDD